MQSPGGGTKISVIGQHRLYLVCSCWHSDSFWVRDTIKVLGEAVTGGFAVDKMRCSRCHTKNVKGHRITYPGGSAYAMRSAEPRGQGREFDG